MPNPVVTLTIPPPLQALMRSGPRPIVGGAIAKALDEQNEYTIGAAVQRRMSFPRTQPSTLEGLRVQSGLLRRSLNRSKAAIGVEGQVTSAIGSNVFYFGLHEFGYEGTAHVAEHRRRLPDRYVLAGGVKADRATVARAGLLTRTGKLRKGQGEQLPERYVMVRAHDRHVNLPARRMVQQTVTERMGAYLSSIAGHITRALGTT